MTHRVLLVDPNKDRFPQLDWALRDVGGVALIRDFPSARRELLENPPDLLMTNLRLGAYNGIHLALLASLSQTRCLVYAKQLDLVLARQVQAASAFYVRLEELPFVLHAFLNLRLPARDRRDPAVVDRRRVFRSGRRSTDVQILNAVFKGSPRQGPYSQH